MLDVCLINLPKPYLKDPHAQQPLGLLYLASVLQENKKAVVLKDYSGVKDYGEIAGTLPHSRLYGITATSLEIPEANRVARVIKNIYPKSKVAIGGPGTLASEHIDTDYINYINHGEGEGTILDILKDAERGLTANAYYGEANDLDSLPEPARGILNCQGGNIFAYGQNYIGSESTIIIYSRGCPYKCAFCSAPRLKSVLRYRDPVLVRDEIKNVIDEYGIRQFRFSDDMFTSNRKKVIELCEQIGPLDIAWRVSCRVKPIDREMLKIMFDAGCKELSFGIESFDNDVLKGLKKGTTALDNAEALFLAESIGFKTRILFMIRTPFQTSKTIEINKYYIERVPYDIIACTAFVPIPGCDIWYNPESYGVEILDRNLDNYNFYMFDANGRRPIDRIIKIRGRSIDSFHKESEEFRDYIEEKGKVNRG